jgi:hypothetical protein
MTESPLWAIVDLAAFLLSRAGHHTARAASELRRRRRLVRLLRGQPVLVGTVAALRPIVAPLSGERVAACRLIVEQARDDGTWQAVFDETQLGELELRHARGCTPIEAPVVLACAERRFGGLAVRELLAGARLELEPRLEPDELRASELLIRDGERVHLFGIELAEIAAASPYRTSPARAERTREVPAVLITPFPLRELARELQRRPLLLPR